MTPTPTGSVFGTAEGDGLWLDPGDPRWPYLHGTGLQSDDPEAAIGHLQRAAALCGGGGQGDSLLVRTL